MPGLITTFTSTEAVLSTHSRQCNRFAPDAILIHLSHFMILWYLSYTHRLTRASTVCTHKTEHRCVLTATTCINSIAPLDTCSSAYKFKIRVWSKEKLSFYHEKAVSHQENMQIYALMYLSLQGKS